MYRQIDFLRLDLNGHEIGCNRAGSGKLIRELLDAGAEVDAVQMLVRVQKLVNQRHAGAEEAAII
jgi:hypothetical protein